MNIQKSNEAHIMRLYAFIRDECMKDAPMPQYIDFSNVNEPALKRISFEKSDKTIYVLTVPVKWLFDPAGSSAALVRMFTQSKSSKAYSVKSNLE